MISANVFFFFKVIEPFFSCLPNFEVVIWNFKWFNFQCFLTLIAIVALALCLRASLFFLLLSMWPVFECLLTFWAKLSIFRPWQTTYPGGFYNLVVIDKRTRYQWWRQVPSTNFQSNKDLFAFGHVSFFFSRARSFSKETSWRFRQD